MPTESYYGGVMKLSHYFNGEGVVMYHIPNAITDGDSIVHFRTSDVIAAGDIFTFAATRLSISPRVAACRENSPR